MNRFVKYQLPACLWAGLIFVFSSIKRLPAPQLGVNFADKIGHFIVYLIFGFLLVRASLSISARGKEKRAILLAAALGILWGIVDEIHQAFVPGRDASFLDGVADAAGVLLISFVILWRVKRRSRVQGDSRRKE